MAAAEGSGANATVLRIRPSRMGSHASVRARPGDLGVGARPPVLRRLARRRRRRAAEQVRTSRATRTTRAAEDGGGGIKRRRVCDAYHDASLGPNVWEPPCRTTAGRRPSTREAGGRSLRCPAKRRGTGGRRQLPPTWSSPSSRARATRGLRVGDDPPEIRALTTSGAPLVLRRRPPRPGARHPREGTDKSIRAVAPERLRLRRRVPGEVPAARALATDDAVLAHLHRAVRRPRAAAGRRRCARAGSAAIWKGNRGDRAHARGVEVLTDSPSLKGDFC